MDEVKLQNSQFDDQDLKLFHELCEKKERYNKYKNLNICLFTLIIIIFWYIHDLNQNKEKLLPVGINLNFNEIINIIIAVILVFVICHLSKKLIVCIWQYYQIKTYKERVQIIIFRESIKRIYNYTKNINNIMMYFIKLTVVLLVFMFLTKTSLEKNNAIIWLTLCSVILYRDSSKAMRYLIYKLLTKSLCADKQEQRKIKNRNSLGCIFRLRIHSILSPDLYYAKYYKEKLKAYSVEKDVSKNTKLKYEDSKGILFQQWDRIRIIHYFYIIFSNWANLIISVFLINLFMIISTFQITNLTIFIQILVTLRLISRTIEIIFSFYKDITSKKDQMFFRINGINPKKIYYIHNWKDSFLLKGNRLSLAVHSLVEVFILYGALYTFLINQCSKSVEAVIPIWIDGFIHSILVSTMNLQCFSEQLIYFQIATIAQIITVLVLVVFSFASYLGEPDIKIREKKLFKDYYIWKRNNKNIQTKD